MTNKAAGSQDAFIAKYDALGNFLWAKSAGGTATDVGSSVTVDQTGNVYLGGSFKSTSIAFGNGITLTKPSNGYINDYLVKYNASGVALWAKTCINTTGNDGINSVTADKFGNVYSTGSFESPTITFDTVKITNSSPNLQDIFITKYNTTGTLLWAKGFGGTGNELGKSISADTNNSVYLAGQFSSATTAFDSNVLTNSSGSADVFVAKIFSESEPDSIILNYCVADSVATLVAYDGHSTYSWLDSNGNIVGISKTLSIKNPEDSSTYICNMTSLDNRVIKHHVTILKYETKADFSFQNNCNSNTVQFNDLSTFTRGTLNYKWNFGDGKVSTEKNPQHVYSTSGIHTVSLELSNPPSICTITRSKSIETFIPDLVGIDGSLTYCKGKTTVLKGHGASGYTWSTGSKADSIEVGTPGNVWLIGNSITGCLTDTIRCIISEEPDWILKTEGNTYFCEGDSTILSAAGADNYEWNTGAKANSIAVKSPGTYSVVGRSASGCEQSRSFTVTEILFSTANFSISSLTVDSRHNQIECSVPTLLDVEYSWDMGDGTIKTGSSIKHNYNVSNSLLEYTITLTATNKYGCTKTLSKKIDVIPFIPNVFTPNGDGTNERFMPDVDLMVLDRYGIMLYKGTDGWDGTFNGKKADPDVYFYYINYKDKLQQVKTKKGSVTLVR